MSRWLFLLSCFGVLTAVAQMEPQRALDARPLGGVCETTAGCREGLACAHVEGVLAGQCSAVCNADTACQQAFGGPAVCLGADRCARGCGPAGECPVGTACNAFGWCERPSRPRR